MIEPSSSPLDVEQLIQRVREEAARRQQAAAPAETAPTPRQGFYPLGELLRHDDVEFVTKIHRCVLRREPDPDSLRDHLNRLRSGERSKIDLLRDLRFSPEGERIGVEVRGLLPPAARGPLNPPTRVLPANPPFQDRPAGAVFNTPDPNPLPPRRAESLSLSELLEPSDEAFVTHAYHMLLRREPDATGGSHYLERLRTGRSTKIQVLGQLRYSREGRQAGVTVPGLWLPFVLQTVYRLPVIGGILALAALILRPRDLIARLRRLEAREERFRTEIAAQRARQQGLAEELTQVKWLADTKANGVEWLELRRRVEDGPATAREQAFQERVEQALNRMREQLFDQQQAFQERVEQALNRMREQLFDQRRHLVDQQRRLGLLLEEARKRLPAPLDEQQLATFADEHDHRLDALYVSFEDCFRGTRTEIEQRLRVYLPHLRQAGVGVDDRPILDLGCGRGEWLELLAQEGFIARGIDLNRVMVAECRDRGLRVEQAEALACLRALPDASLGAVTGLHVIEHLSLATLVDLLDEALRVVRPGGLAIFETPNPENLRVGAYNFYFDPTHRNPLPPSLSAFLLEGRGWTPVEILRLNPYPEHQRFSVDGGQSQVTSWLNEVFCGPQDYAVLGHKP